MVSHSSMASLAKYLTEDEIKQSDALINSAPIWTPLPGPQTQAYISEADVMGYGGAAGGGKTDLIIGKCLTQFTKAAVFRRHGPELSGILDRFTELLGSRNDYNGKDNIWRLPGRQIEFGSIPHAGDEAKHQGRDKQLLVIDEAVNCLESQVRFLMGWVRTTVQGQRCQTVMTFNPPTTSDGRWVVDYFGPWLDDMHPNPAEPGEIRWYATVNGEDREVESKEPFYNDGELIKPLSRTFIPSRITDNPYLMGTGYMSTLQSMPEPLRSQMLHGDFKAGMEEDPFQCIPSTWVDAAMERWKERAQKGPMVSMGVDVACGGLDNTIIFNKHEGNWFDMPLVYPGSETPDGNTSAAKVIAARKNRAPVHVDFLGPGSGCHAVLQDNNVQVIKMIGSQKSTGKTLDGSMGFVNRRSELYWRLREELDPQNDTGIAIPPVKRLRSELCLPKWTPSSGNIKVESKESVVKRLKRSPDYADALANANVDTMREEDRKSLGSTRNWNPYAREGEAGYVKR